MRYMSNRLHAKNDITMDYNKEEIFKRDFERAMATRIQRHSPVKKGKRFRIAFTTDQINYLENEFKKSPYIGNDQRKFVASILNIPERAIKIWFQNRRMKEKKDVNKEFDFDDQKNDTTEEYFNDQLHNVHALPLTNSQHSLPKLVSSDDPNEVIIDKNINNYFTNFTDVNKSDQDTDLTKYPVSIADIINKNEDFHLDKPSTTAASSSGEFAIELCKRYRNTQKNIKKPVPCIQIKQDDSVIKDRVSNIIDQVTPQDLSINNRRKLSHIQTVASTSATVPEYVPLYMNTVYPQPYISTPNMFWNPVNVLPFVGTEPTASALVTGAHSQQQSHFLGKKNCTCDCHVTSQPTAYVPPVAFQNDLGQPTQYVITAIPVQHTNCHI